MKASTVRTLADVDWNNFDYGTFKGRMRDGRATVHLYAKIGDPHDTISHQVRSVAYGNKQSSTAIVIERTMWTEASGVSSTSSEIHVYRLVGRKPELVSILDVATPVHEVRFESQAKISVSSGDPVRTQRFRFVEGEYVEVPQPA